MHLLNTRTRKLHSFLGSRIPAYTILSHRWSDDELTFQGLQSGASLVSSEGYEKMAKFCGISALNGYDWCWVDTCCINKESSAELTEAINSMYQWYKGASVCYAYLSDVLRGSYIGDSLWFTRGWTLQELLAPTSLVFYNFHWDTLGSKESMASLLSQITAVELDVLRGHKDVLTASIAQRMSWASKRQTTRIEDTAYSLLGLFDVNMPLLYGEGERAFRRLQEEIIKQSNDRTIFAWHYKKPGCCGLLAPSPANFLLCSSYVQLSRPRRGIHHPFQMTNLGLAIKMPLRPCGMEYFIAYLDCIDGSHWFNDQRGIGIFVTLIAETGQYARVSFNGTGICSYSITGNDDVAVYDMYVRQQIKNPPLVSSRSLGYLIGSLTGYELGTVTRIHCRQDQYFEEHFMGFSITTLLKWTTLRVVMILGFDFSFQPVVYVGRDIHPQLFPHLSSLKDQLKRPHIGSQNVNMDSCEKDWNWVNVARGLSDTQHAFVIGTRMYDSSAKLPPLERGQSRIGGTILPNLLRNFHLDIRQEVVDARLEWVVHVRAFVQALDKRAFYGQARRNIRDLFRLKRTKFSRTTTHELETPERPPTPEEKLNEARVQPQALLAPRLAHELEATARRPPRLAHELEATVRRPPRLAHTIELLRLLRDVPERGAILTGVPNRARESEPVSVLTSTKPTTRESSFLESESVVHPKLEGMAGRIGNLDVGFQQQMKNSVPQPGATHPVEDTQQTFSHSTILDYMQAQIDTTIQKPSTPNSERVSFPEVLLFEFDSEHGQAETPTTPSTSHLLQLGEALQGDDSPTGTASEYDNESLYALSIRE